MVDLWDCDYHWTNKYQFKNIIYRYCCVAPDPPQGGALALWHWGTFANNKQKWWRSVTSSLSITNNSGMSTNPYCVEWHSQNPSLDMFEHRANPGKKRTPTQQLSDEWFPFCKCPMKRWLFLLNFHTKHKLPNRNIPEKIRSLPICAMIKPSMFLWLLVIQSLSGILWAIGYWWYNQSH